MGNLVGQVFSISKEINKLILQKAELEKPNFLGQERRKKRDLANRPSSYEHERSADFEKGMSSLGYFWRL